MQYAVLKLREEWIAVALVEQWQLGLRHAATLVEELQAQLKAPVMLVARDCSNWRNARAYADFNTAPYLLALIGLDEVEWRTLHLAADCSVES